MQQACVGHETEMPSGAHEQPDRCRQRRDSGGDMAMSQVGDDADDDVTAAAAAAAAGAGSAGGGGGGGSGSSFVKDRPRSARTSEP